MNRLTARQKGTDSEAPMCGVPHHAVEGYIAKLLKIGRKVAVCDQMEDPAKAKGLVKREITRVVTPGTLSSPELLEAREAHLLGGMLPLEPHQIVGERHAESAHLVELLPDLEIKLVPVLRLVLHLIEEKRKFGFQVFECHGRPASLSWAGIGP